MSSYWKRYQPTREMPWNLQRVKHLQRRAGLGVTWSELQRDLRDGHEAAIDRLLNGQSRSYAQRDDFESISQVLADSAVHSGDEQRLKAWWFYRFLWTPDPLREKLTLMWHNHFATSNLKVNNLQLMQQQNNLLGRHATSKFGELLHEVLRDPAMLVWLDSNSNRSGHPNENLGRELMELFTLGVGNYDENDVKEAARALTGWSVKDGAVRFREEHFDNQPKTVLGRTKNFDADSLAELLLSQRATSHRLAWRLCDLFMGEQIVNEPALTELAEGLFERQLDIRWAVEQILRSELFFIDANIGSRISSPVEYIVGTLRSLEMLSKSPSTLILSGWSTRLGQDLFRPSNVGGWNGGRSWLNSRTIVGRANFAEAMVVGELHTANEPHDFKSLISSHLEQQLESTSSSTESHLRNLLLCTDKASIALEQTNPPAMIVQLLASPQAFLN